MSLSGHCLARPTHLPPQAPRATCGCDAGAHDPGARPNLRPLEIRNVNPVFSITPLRAASLLLALSLAGCTVTSSDVPTVDYKAGSVKTAPLDVPPDLTQLAREGRYQSPTSVVSASSMRPSGTTAAPATSTQAAATAAPAAAVPAVALNAVGDLRIERQGDTRWLVTPMTPEALYPQVRKFWNDTGFALVIDDPKIGLLETEWAENRAKVPQGWLRATLGKAIDGFYSTPYRDKYRCRIERTATGTEVYITHRGMVETYTDGRKDQTEWQMRPRDPDLEAELLARLMVALGAREETARAATGLATPAPAPAVATAAAAAPPKPAQPSPVALPATAQLELDQGFDRAWRQVGVALDRGGFTIEDRDRGAGLYFVRYIDPKLAGREEPSFFGKLFSSEKEVRPQRLRVAVKSTGAKTLVSIQTSEGAPDNSDQARAIIGRIGNEMK